MFLKRGFMILKKLIGLVIGIAVFFTNPEKF